MTVTVRNKSALVVPPSVRRRAGLKHGDQVEFRVSGSVIKIIPKSPSADVEYTPTQRRIIDARLAESADDLKRGRTFGPFSTANEMIASVKRELKKSAASTKTQRSQ